MAILNCDECGGPVHSKNNVCLRCGIQNKAKSDHSVFENQKLRSEINELKKRLKQAEISSRDTEAETFCVTSPSMVTTEFRENGNGYNLRYCCVCLEGTVHDTEGTDGYLSELFEMVLSLLHLIFVWQEREDKKKGAVFYRCQKCRRRYGGALTERERRLKEKNQERLNCKKIAKAVSTSYLVEACKKCSGTKMLLNKFEPEGRAVQYQCLSCVAGGNRCADACSNEYKAVYELAVRTYGSRAETGIKAVFFETVVA